VPSSTLARPMTTAANPADPIQRDVDRIFPGAGEMARLCRAHDWSATPLGPVEQWPASLRVAAGMAVAQGIAQNLCWGPELLQIYNDAFREIMGDKHPAGLGRSVLWSWAEVMGEVGPLFERVRCGETVYFEDLPLRIFRHGVDQDVNFTFSYSPVRTETGVIGGVLINCFETTRQVQSRMLQSERDRLFDELQLERERLSFVFQQSPQFLAVLRGPTHVFELVNEAYYQLVGHRELIGKPLWEAVPEARGHGFEELLDGVLATGQPVVARDLRIPLARTRGAPPEERFIDLTYMPLLDAAGRRVGVIAHGTDVTDQVRARHEVERLLHESERARADAEAARVEAEEANRAKAEFLRAMSHELRTPLNAIGGYVELIEMGIHGPVTEAQRVALGRVSTSQRHLLTLINDILVHARMEAGHIEFDLQPLPATRLLSGVEPLVAPMAEARGISCRVTDCDGTVDVLADEERVRQVLLNLVGNAVKFTERGGAVELTCAAEAEWVRIRVRDDGRGIPADKLQAIFDPFMQVGRALNRPESGVGLGLAISRSLARGMGGDLTVESTVGAGSTFTLTLPRA